MAVLRIMRSRAALRLCGITAAAGLIAAGAGVGAGAASATAQWQQGGLLDRQMNPRAASAAVAAEEGHDPLKVTVGKSVIITTDAAGVPGLKMLVSNTQVSGTGKATVKVPVGTSSPSNSGGFGGLKTEGDNIVYDVDSTKGQVQTLSASGGTYKGQLPISIRVKAWVDGKEVDPAGMFDVTGNVKIEYTFSNLTSKPEVLTYPNALGGTLSKTVDVPVPFGGSFSTVFAPGWADINAPWASSGITPSGQELDGTVIMFPPLGKTETTLSLTARAEHAQLPAATLTAIPVDLGAVADGLLMSAPAKYLPLLDKGVAFGGTAQLEALKYQALVLKYAQIIQNLDTTKIQPFVRQANGVTVTASELNGVIDEIEQAVALASAYFELNGLIAGVASKLATYGSSALLDLAPDISKIPSAVAAVETMASSAESQINAISAKLTTLPTLISTYEAKPIPLPSYAACTGPTGNPCTFGDLVDYMTATCQTAAATNAVYTGQNGSAALTAANAAAPGQGLDTINTDLAAQVKSANDGGTASCNTLSEIFTLLNTATTTWLPALQSLISQVESDLQPLLNVIANLGTSAANWTTMIPQLANELSNTSCQQTAAGIKQCGAAQQLAYLDAQNDEVAAQLTNVLDPFLNKSRGYIPRVIQMLTLTKRTIDIIGAAAKPLPGMMDSFAAKLGGASGMVGSLTAEGEKYGDLIGLLSAEIDKMNRRALAGDGIAYGNATGGDAKTLGAWQYAIAGADYEKRADLINGVLAILLLVVSAGVGTVLWVHHKPVS